MFVGHATVAFALVAGLASLAGWDAERALAIGVLAGAFGLAPDVDILYAPVGLVAHPFGDLFTGAPPDLLYPLDVALVADRLVLHPDPTMHLLAAFGLELLTVWAAAIVYLHATDRRVADHVSPHAAWGLAFAAAVLFVPAPSLDAPYRFVAAALAVGMVSGAGVGFGVDPHRVRAARIGVDRRADRPRLPVLDVGMTGLLAVSTALVAYGTVYLLV